MSLPLRPALITFGTSTFLQLMAYPELPQLLDAKLLYFPLLLSRNELLLS